MTSQSRPSQSNATRTARTNKESVDDHAQPQIEDRVEATELKSDSFESRSETWRQNFYQLVGFSEQEIETGQQNLDESAERFEHLLNEYEPPFVNGRSKLEEFFEDLGDEDITSKTLLETFGDETFVKHRLQALRPHEIKRMLFGCPWFYIYLVYYANVQWTYFVGDGFPEDPDEDDMAMLRNKLAFLKDITWPRIPRCCLFDMLQDERFHLSEKLENWVAKSESLRSDPLLYHDESGTCWEIVRFGRQCPEQAVREIRANEHGSVVSIEKLGNGALVERAGDNTRDPGLCSKIALSCFSYLASPYICLPSIIWFVLWKHDYTFILETFLALGLPRCVDGLILWTGVCVIAALWSDSDASARRNGARLTFQASIDRSFVVETQMYQDYWTDFYFLENRAGGRGAKPFEHNEYDSHTEVQWEILVVDDTIMWKVKDYMDRDFSSQEARDSWYGPAAQATVQDDRFCGCGCYYRGTNSYHVKAMHIGDDEAACNHNHYRYDHTITPDTLRMHLLKFMVNDVGDVWRGMRRLDLGTVMKIVEKFEVKYNRFMDGEEDEIKYCQDASNGGRVVAYELTEEDEKEAERAREYHAECYNSDMTWKDLMRGGHSHLADDRNHVCASDTIKRVREDYKRRRLEEGHVRFERVNF